MRLPFLQIDQDAWTRARTLAGLLHCDRHRAFGLQADLWLWALEMSPDDQVDGVFQDVDPAEMLAAALEWTGPKDRLLTGLVRVGLVEPLPDGFRVRGLSRYGSVLVERRKDAARKALSRSTKLLMSGGSPADGGGNPAESTRHTHTHTHTQREEAFAEDKPPPAAKESQKPRKPRAPSAQERFVAKVTAERDRRGWLPDEKTGAKVANRLLKEPLEKVGELQLWNGFLAFAEDPFALTRDPPCPLRLFAAQWPRHVSAAQKPAVTEEPKCRLV